MTCDIAPLLKKFANDPHLASWLTSVQFIITKNDTAVTYPHFAPKYSVVALNKLTARPLDRAHVRMSVSETNIPLAAKNAHAATEIATAGTNPAGAAKYGIAKNPPPTVVPTTSIIASKSLARSL
jgi:hypothetical protein